MITASHQVTVVTYTSSVVPEIRTTKEHYAEIMQWADENPIAYKIVMTKKSKVFGLGSSTYIACGASLNAPDDILYRAGVLRAFVTGEHGADTIFQWRALFTMGHFSVKGFKGGFFQQFDGTYDRGCLHLDYTPDTLDEVITHFRVWCGKHFSTAAVKLDGKVIRTDVRR